jgi:outer membrane protein OmpA-like peptidoglycan-associated protein
MTARVGWVAFLAALHVTASLHAQAAVASPASAPKPDEPRAFIACPIYRDTDAGRKSGCWLADDPSSGIRYDITLGPVKPQVGRMVLVEGITSVESSTPCGGNVLTPVRIAVLADLCPRTQLPADGYPGRPYKSPSEQLRPASEPRALPPPPYDTRVFTIDFEFGRDFLNYQYAELILEKIWLYAEASHAAKISVDGFAATEALRVGTRTVREPASLAEARANMVAEALRRLGVPESSLQITWHTAPAPSTDLEAGKLPEPSKRRVVITVSPRSGA